jgi:hypothetical protein
VFRHREAGHPAGVSTQQQFPPVVYAPTLELAEGGEARLAMHRTDDGRVALFVYSALDRLTEFYRADSPWVLLTVEDLQRAYDAAPYDLLFLDKRPAPEAVAS